MKNAIYFILKARLGLKILKFLSSLCGYVEKPLRKIRLIWKFNVTTWFTNNRNKALVHIKNTLKDVS